jgi:hypothetical protein
VNLSPSISKIMAISFVLAVGLTVWKAFFEPILSSVSADRIELSILEMSAHQLRSASEVAPPIKNEVDKFEASRVLDSVFLEGDNPTLLSAELQRKSNSIVNAAGATLLSSLTTPIERESGHIRIGLQLDLTATIGALQATLYRLETSTPLLTVDHLAIDAPENTRSQVDMTAPPVFSIHLHVSAYSRSVS